MTSDELKKFRDQRPFQPFEIILVDGRRFTVPHPEFVWVPPLRGTWVYVADVESGSADHINTAVISSVRHLPGSGPVSTNGAGH